MKVNQIKKVGKVGMGGLITVLSLVVSACGSGTGAASGSASAIGNTNGGGSGSSQPVGGNTGGVTITNIYSQPKDLSVGDLMFADLNSSSGSIDFSGTNSSSEYVLVVANTSYGKTNFNVQLSGDLSSADLDVEKSLDDGEVVQASADINDVTEKFHDTLRQRELDLVNLPLPQENQEGLASKAADAAQSATEIKEGDSRSFKVLGSLSSTSSAVDVTAVADCVRSNVAFYVDSRVGQNVLSGSDVNTLCNQFNDTVGKEQSLFGSLSDLNGDGKVLVLMTPQVNKLGAVAGGIITGFFTANDLYPNSSTNAASNTMEILYVMVPDPNGAYGVKISKEFAMSNLLPAVLPHELQHAISYNQHVFVNKGNAEEAWLNEGMSHLAEDLFGQGQENPSRYNIFLKSPNSYSLVTSSSPGLAARGAAYLFLRFLYEQSGNNDGFLKNLIQTSNTGVRNIEVSFAGRSNDFDQFGEFFLRWTVALAATDAGLTQDRRFTYQPRVKDSVTGQWHGVCLRCTAEDNRGTVLSGVSVASFSGVQNATTAPSAARFLKVSGIKGKLAFSGSNSINAGYGVLIRTK